MRAEQIAENFPVVELGSSGLAAAQLMARHRLPGLVVIDTQGRPYSILPASQVVRFLVPRYVQDDPALAGVLTESMADHAAEQLGQRSVRSLLPDEPTELPMVRYDDTIIEVAATMGRLRSPLVVVLRDDLLVGVITASRLLEFALASTNSPEDNA